MIKILLAICIIISLFSILLNLVLWLRVNELSKKRKELKGLVLQNQKDYLINIENHKNLIENLSYQVKQLKSHIQQLEQQQTGQLRSPKNHVANGSKHISSEKKDKNDSGKTKNMSTVLKTIYLGINSDDMFFEMEEQKNESSKFVAELTSATEGTFKPIDVERIRAANVAFSMKQQGVVSIKDARSFKVVEPGKILKEKEGWHIEKPVVVEFIK